MAFIVLIQLHGTDFLPTYIMALTQNSSRNDSRQYYLTALIVSTVIVLKVEADNLYSATSRESLASDRSDTDHTVYLQMTSHLPLMP